MEPSAAPASAPGLRLRVVAAIDPRLVDQEFVLLAPAASIGRGADCDLVIADEGISRHHARLEVDAAGGLTVSDQQSANGVFVGSRRVERASVPPGGRFTLGATTFVVEAAAEPTFAGAIVPGRTMHVANLGRLAAEIEAPSPLSEQGEEVTALANQPWLISDPGAAWRVESGKVEIFTVAVESGRPVGARSHFLSVGPGEAFFGVDTARFGHDWGLLAVGKAGSRLHRFDLRDLELLALVPEHREEIARLVEGWARALARRLAAALDLPAPAIQLTAGEEARLEPGKIAAAAGGSVVWLAMPSGFFLFDGIAGLSPEVEGIFFPLPPQSWLEPVAGDPGDAGPAVVPRSTVDGVRDARLWAGLDAFHRVICECESLDRRVAVADEVVRLGRKAEREASAREAGIGAIEGVLGGTRAWERPAFGAVDLGPVFTACSLVAAGTGIDLRRPVGELEDLSFDEKVQAIAAASHFRIRRVALADDWWNRDQGPLLGQREGDGAPVAILPAKAGRYDRVDPRSGERTRLDEERAGELSPFAYSFYRPFDDGPVSARQLARFAVRGLKREFVAVALAGVGVGLLSTVTPAITGMVFDNAIPQAERLFLLELCLGLFLVALSTAAFKITQNVATLRVQGRMDYSAQAAVWDRLLNLPATFFRGFSAGDLSDRAAAVDTIRSIVAGTGVAAILGSFASLFNVVQMALYNLPLAAVAVGLTLAYVAMTTGCNYFKLRVQRQELHQRGSITGLVLQLITGVAKLRVSGSEPHAFRVWATGFAALRRTSFRVGRIGNLMPVINGGFPVISSLVVFLTVATMRLKALERGEVFELTTGEFLAFSAAYGIFLAAMQALGDASVNLLNVVPVFERLAPILDQEAEVDRSKQPPARLRGGITVSHLHFRYGADAPYVLRDVSLTIEPGEFVALVGGSGSGKSTLMKVMLGFERPDKGGVYYDGQDLSTLDVRLVRQQLGVVLQESRLLPADIYRNIVGSSARTVAEAWEAARQAGLDEDIRRMPMGMHTYVSEGGGGFSGGQKQRLMIARALVHRPKILFLDEATSALDNRSQAIVTESMDRIQATRVVIAHRLSTIINADRICYLENGTIAEMGSYDELMVLDGAFARLARRQLS
jgi:ATP-binding cassette subfamily C protein